MMRIFAKLPSGLLFMNIYSIIPNNITDAKIYIKGMAHKEKFLLLLSF